MSNRDGFAGGLIVGAIVGGIAGTLLGITLAKRQEEEFDELPEGENVPDGRSLPADRPPSRKKIAPAAARGSTRGSTIEQARQGLEDKIAQLNTAIDDVRRQLSGPAAQAANGRLSGRSPAPLPPEPGSEVGK